ncbi:MAG: 50S ribosomal protein L4 [Proteobacteria bacterium]|nr:50S ribosomal protein L4 [Pseudomonadota bacterium]
MLKTDLYNIKGEKVGKITLPEKIFGLKPDNDLLNEAVVSQQSASRVKYAHVKMRGEVRGGGRKPWAQKGTGRARHGSIRSPIWIGGGVTHGPVKEKKAADDIFDKNECPTCPAAQSCIHSKIKKKTPCIL